MRDGKYKQYGQVARSAGGNVLVVRYEDLAAGPAFLFEALADAGSGAGSIRSVDVTRRVPRPRCRSDLDVCRGTSSPQALPCARVADFRPVNSHAKFGVESGRKHEDAGTAWGTADWAALRSRVDLDFDASLGYQYRADAPIGDVVRPPLPTWLLRPPEEEPIVLVRGEEPPARG